MSLTRRMKALARSWGIGARGDAVEPRAVYASGREPLVSVIVPVYNVERYLAACLQSLCAQTHRKLQVIIVDDGSTDSSSRIAAQFALSDPRLTVVRQENAGLGAARNAGIALVQGDYLAFLDSDDSLPPRAYEDLVSSLEGSNSDFSVGAITRIRANGTRSQPGWSRELHAAGQRGIRPDEFPHILRDFYSPNKLFRASFWHQNGFRFREGVLFEDQPLITRIYCAAVAIDVLTEVTYEWLIRDDGSSLSQAMYTRDNIRQRREAIELTLSALLERNSAELLTGWRWTLQEHHFVSYLSQARTLDSDAYEAVVDMVRSVIDVNDLVTTDGVSNYSNVLLYLALHSSRQNVEAFLARHGKNSYLFPVVPRDGTLYSRLPFFGEPDPGVPLSLFAVAPHQVTLAAIVEDYIWLEGNRLKVDGVAFIANAEAGQAVEVTRAFLFNPKSRAEIPVDLWHESQDRAETWGYSRIDGWEFGLILDFAELSRTFPSSFEAGEAWQIKLEVQRDGVAQTLGFTHRRETRRSVAGLSGTTIAPSLAIGARWAADCGLTFSVARRPIHASKVALTGTDVGVDLGQGFGEFEPKLGVLVGIANGAEVFAPLSRVGTSSYTANFHLPTTTPAGQVWRAHVQDSTGARRVVHTSADVALSVNAGTSNVRATTGPGAQLQIEFSAECSD